MALPGSSRGSGLTRSEAAILAWKKRPRAKPKNGALDPKIAARVKQILAGKVKKGPKGKGGKAKPKGTKQEIANQNRAAIAKQSGIDDGVIVRLGAGMDSDLEKDAHDELISKGLAKRGADGKPKLTPAGRKWRSAADKGDVEAAGAALAEGRSGASEAAAKETAKGAKQAERATAKQAKQAESAKKKQAVAAKQKQALVQRAKMKQAAEKVKAAKKQSQAAAAKEKADKPAKEQAENRAKVAKDMADQDAGLAPGGSAALNDFADGKPLKEETAKQFEEMGLTEKDEAGNHRLTTEGRAAANAMSKGDTRAAIDAISRAGSKKKKADTPKERKAIDMSDLAIKAGARHSKMDMGHIQGIHDSAVACGANCGTDDEEDGDDEEDMDGAEKAIKSIMDNPLYYAQHECSDIMQAANALSTVAMLIQSELVEEDEDDAHIALLCDAARTLVKFISAELDELEGAAGDAADNARMGPMRKGVELATLDDGEQLAVVNGYSVKALNDTGLVGGYLVKFGGDGDLSTTHDIFTNKTNYGSHTKSAVWVHHRMLPGVGKRQLTNEAELGMDDEGVFVKHLLDLRNVYEAKLYDMAKNGKLGWSSGTAPNLVERKALGDGRHEITQWPLGLDASYTPMPAGGFVVNASAMKALMAEIGLEAIDDSQEAINPTAVKADGRETADDERARVLLLELDLLALELETA